MREMKNASIIVVGKPLERNHVGDLDVNGRTMSKWIFEKYGVNAWAGLNWFRSEFKSGALCIR
jgi:hypothetical protein